MAKAPQVVQLAKAAGSLQLAISTLQALPDFSEASCRKPDQDPDLWFAEEQADIALAKSICSACPVLDTCLVYALSDPTLDGMWAGTLPTDRELLLNSASIVLEADDYKEGIEIISKTALELASKYGVAERTVCRWKATLRSQDIFASQVELAA
jgi:hypothetical protein